MSSDKGKVRLSVHVQPRAGQNKVVSYDGKVLSLKIKAAPVKGSANEEVIEFLSDMLDIPKSNISIERGLSGKQKLVDITGLNLKIIEQRIKTLID